LKKIRKQGAHLAALDTRRRHKLRIRAKKLRYAVDFFASLFPRKGSLRRRAKFIAGLKKLQDSLGDLNDIVVHAALSKRIAAAAPDAGRRQRKSIRKAFAAGRLSGQEEARFAAVLRGAERHFDSFGEAKPFWS
jgi:CHAD domain-containing protein